MSSEDIHYFLQMRNQIKLYHWQTRVYARHIASDKAVDELDKLIDSYVEIYIGKYGRKKLTGKQAVFQLMNMSEAGIVKFIHACIKYFQGPLTKGLNKEKDTDLLNLRDEIVGALNQLLYLFTLH